MTIDEFINKEKELLYAFKLYWEGTEDLPNELDPGDWDEQFAFFIGE